MGGFLSYVAKFVKWMGDIVYKVIKWFDGAIRKYVSKIVEDFLIQNKPRISKAENKPKVMKVIGMKKMNSELEKVAEKEYQELSSNDQDLISKMIENGDFS